MTTKPLLAALRGRRVDPPPIWFMRQAGRYLPEYRQVRAGVGSFLELCLTPHLASEVTLQPVRRFQLDGAVIFADILLVPYALGQPLWFEAGRGPQLTPLEAPEDVATLNGRDVPTALAPMYDALARTRAQLPQHTALIGFAGAPWTTASYMLEGQSSRDFLPTKRWAYAAPERFQRLIDKLVQETARHLCAQIDAGAEAVQLFDSWAGSLPPDGVARWSLEPTRRIVAAVRAHAPDVPVIVFPRGVGAMYSAFAAESGADALSLDTVVPWSWAAREVQPRLTVQGSLDPHHVAIGGSGMIAAVREIRRAFADGAHVFNLGHGIVPATPPEHVAAVVDAVREREGR